MITRRHKRSTHELFADHMADHIDGVALRNYFPQNKEKSEVWVDASQIPLADMGLFANRDFHKGEHITLYDGMLLSTKEAKGANVHTHLRTVKSFGDLVIDGYKWEDIKHISHGVGAGAFANDAHNTPFSINATYVNIFPSIDQKFMVTLQATTDIAQGQEIFVSYGRGYWRNQ